MDLGLLNKFCSIALLLTSVLGGYVRNFLQSTGSSGLLGHLEGPEEFLSHLTLLNWAVLWLGQNPVLRY